ncbi:MAG TPA: PhzF family phenazine biosynthesis protein [Vicinamibacterales bacterium]|nr:PhzF family phenazine biosynthesis protein [Vicinamibacterales bacterium]
MLTRREFGSTSAAALFALRSGPQAPATAARAQRYVHLDVFTDTALAGNQLLVYTAPTGLTTEQMQALTRESNYSENTFALPPEQAGTDYRVRIFTRTAEAPFAGHPTIGTAFALAHTGAIKAGTPRVVFGLGVGPTPLDLEWSNARLRFAWMTQLNPTFGKPVSDTGALAAAMSLNPGDVVRAAQEVNCGSNFLIVPIASRRAVDAAALDRAKIDAVFAAAGLQRRGLYIVTTDRGSDDATAYSRLLGTGGIEDPATGSAAGPAGCYLAKYGLVPAERLGSMVFLQGVLAGRPSRLHVKIGGSGSDITKVQVGGASVIVGEGTVML